MDLPILDISYKWNHKTCDLLCLLCFQSSSMFYHISVLHSFYDQIIFRCVFIPHFVYPFTCRWTLSCFQLLTIVDSAAVNMHIQVYVCVPVFNYFGMYLVVELLVYMVNLCLTFWGTSKLFSTVAESFYIPTSNVWGFQFLHILANTCYFLFYFLF